MHNFTPCLFHLAEVKLESFCGGFRDSWCCFGSRSKILKSVVKTKASPAPAAKYSCFIQPHIAARSIPVVVDCILKAQFSGRDQSSMAIVQGIRGQTSYMLEVVIYSHVLWAWIFYRLRLFQLTLLMLVPFYQNYLFQGTAVSQYRYFLMRFFFLHVFPITRRHDRYNIQKMKSSILPNKGYSSLLLYRLFWFWYTKYSNLLKYRNSNVFCPTAARNRIWHNCWRNLCYHHRKQHADRFLNIRDSTYHPYPNPSLLCHFPFFILHALP